jgi:hypothetical protein
MTVRLLALAAFVLTTGCAANLYTPGTPPMPLHRGAHEAHVSVRSQLSVQQQGQTSERDGLPPLQGFASMTPLPHVIVYGSGLRTASLPRYLEGGVGTYAHLGHWEDVPLSLEVLAGWGRGPVDLDYQEPFDPLYLLLPFFCLGPEGCPSESYRVTGTLTRESLQATLGSEAQLSDAVSVATGGTLRLSRVTLSDAASTGPTLAPAERAVYLQPGATGRIDVRGIGLELSGSVLVPLSRFPSLRGSAAQTVQLGMGLYVKPERLLGLVRR